MKRHEVAQLVEALFYKPEGCGFDSRWCHWNFFSIDIILPHYGAGVNSTSNIYEYKEYLLGGNGGRYVQLTTLPLHVPNVMKSGSLNLLEPLGPVQASTGIASPVWDINLLCVFNTSD